MSYPGETIKIPCLEAIALLILWVFLGFGSLEATSLQSRIGAASDLGKPHRESHVLVRIADGDDPGAILRGRLAHHLFGGWYRVALTDPETTAEVLYDTHFLAGVETIELDYLVASHQAGGSYLMQPEDHSGFTPNDPLFPIQWGFRLIGMRQAWEVGAGKGTTLAIIDTGVTSLGEDLTCHVFRTPFNAITGRNGPGVAEDDNSHGSHVAGTALQCTDNGLGVAGVAYEADLMPVKVLDESGNGSFGDVAMGIDWAVDHGAMVVNMSFGATCDAPWSECRSSVIDDAIDRAVARDVVLVASAGNTHSPFLSLPANHPEVIAVTAVGITAQILGYSDFDTSRLGQTALAAPGGNVTVDLNDDGYRDGILQETLGVRCGSPQATAYCVLQGTSMASAHVAGAAALLRALHSEASRRQVMDAIWRSAADFGEAGYDSFYGHGLLQVQRAIEELASILAVPEPFTCISGPEVLCIAAHDDVWEVTMQWSRISHGGRALAVDLSTVGITQGGAFAFGDTSNPEVLIKILDFCALGGPSYAVFLAPTTDVGFTIVVRQSSTGKAEVYRNVELTPASPVQDMATVFTCP